MNIAEQQSSPLQQTEMPDVDSSRASLPTSRRGNLGRGHKFPRKAKLFWWAVSRNIVDGQTLAAVCNHW